MEGESNLYTINVFMSRLKSSPYSLHVWIKNWIEMTGYNWVTIVIIGPNQVRLGWPYLEWASMMSWMYLLDPQNHILKVLCHNLEFWLSYSGSLNKLLTSERRERDKREIRERGTCDFSGCLAKCYGRAKDWSWARAAQLPRILLCSTN